jgi:hypothetical protein
MACDISLGRLEGCKDQVGGLKSIYFINFSDMGALTESNETITGIENGYVGVLSGTVSVSAASTAVVGVGTLFTTELAVGDGVKIGSETFIVSAIADNLNLTLSVAHSVGAAAVSMTKAETKAYKYDLRGNSTFEQSLTSSRENGTTFCEQTLTVSLKAQDAATHKEVKSLAYGRPHILIEDNNGNIFMVGQTFGAEMTASTSTGAAMGDKSGYELSFVASEKGLAKFYTNNPSAEFAVQLGV